MSQGESRSESLRQRELGLAAQLVHQRPARARRHQDLAAAGATVPIGILARLVEFRAMVRVLDERDRETPLRRAVE